MFTGTGLSGGELVLQGSRHSLAIFGAAQKIGASANCKGGYFAFACWNQVFIPLSFGALALGAAGVPIWRKDVDST